MVTIATFNDADKAKRLKERLQQAGLQADMINEGHIQQVAFMSKPQANIKVKVDDNEFEKALGLMIQWESTDPEIASAMIRCPQCNLEPRRPGGTLSSLAPFFSRQRKCLGKLLPAVQIQRPVGLLVLTSGLAKSMTDALFLP